MTIPEDTSGPKSVDSLKHSTTQHTDFDAPRVGLHEKHSPQPTQHPPRFAELHCLTNFTFLRGASRADELVERAVKLGYHALAITDECSLAGVVRAHEAAKEHKLKLIIGAEFTLVDGLKFVLLAQNRTGYGNLSALITHARRNAEKGAYRLDRNDVDNRDLTHCLALLIPPSPSVDAGDQHVLSALHVNAQWMHQQFPQRSWLAVELHRGAHDEQHLSQLYQLSHATGLPLVATNDVHMHARGRRALQDVLTATRLGTTVAEAGFALFPNGERHLRPLETLTRIYPPELLAQSVVIADQCTFSLETLRYEYPEELAPPGETTTTWLRKCVERGLVRRFGPVTKQERTSTVNSANAQNMTTSAESESVVVAQSRSASTIAERIAASPKSMIAERIAASPESIDAQSITTSMTSATTASETTVANVPPHVRQLIEHELALVSELQYEPYFLTVHDVVEFARSQGILCQGRGSAANSAVCYALGITEVDPARMSVLFERFISKERNEPPDIDVDFEHQRREEVIQYIYSKYTRDRAAIAATVSCYRTRSAFRDVGKALGLDLAQVDRIAKNLAFWDRGPSVPERMREAGFDPESPVIRRLLTLTKTLIGFPRHLSQHVGGFVISRGPLSHLVPIENAAMPDRTVIQWDKDDLDSLGLLKVDVLALGMLSAIRRALDMVSAYRGKRLRMQDIPAEDPNVYAMLHKADTVGVFQIESRAQMSMLPRLKPRCFYDLVIEVAIVRPGPIQGGMVHPYLRRRQGLEPVTYPSKAVESVLKRTLGVPIFQEQVMQLAVVAAGFTPGEADKLRRSMAAWRRKGGLEHFEQRLIDGMRERGYTEQFAQQIYQQILGFGEYGFPESHSASFALLVYVSSWLKRYEPAAFCAALLNSQPMGFYAPAQLTQDARRHGVTIAPVNALISEWDCTLEAPGDAQCSPSLYPHVPPQPVLRLGLRMVNGLSQAGAERLIEARKHPFEDFEALALCARLNRKDLEALAHAGALAHLAGHRRQALWQVAGIEARPPVLHDTPIREITPQLRDLTEGESIVADYSSLGLTLGRHPVALLRDHLHKQRMLNASQLLKARHGQHVRAAGLVTCRQRPGTASGVIFVTLEDETGSTNVVVWRDLSERQRRTLLGSKLMGVIGVLEREGDVAHLIAAKLIDLSHLLGRLTTHSRDFH